MKDHNILFASAAMQLRQELERNPQTWLVEVKGPTLYGIATITARRKGRRGILTGGLAVTASSVIYAHMSPRAVSHTAHLRPGWGAGALYNAVERLCGYVACNHGLRGLQEAIYNEVLGITATNPFTEEEMEEIGRISKETGYSTDYQEMNATDVRFWKEWISKRNIGSKETL